MQLRGGDPEQIGGYPLEARLGSGGMGTVFLARTESGRPVAIKLIHKQFADDEEFRIRFRQEVSAARRVSGVFTAAVVDADPEGAHPWMATAYIPGPTLAQRISDGGSLHGAELRRLAIGLAEALREIHRAGVIHRDLKPSNVVLSPDGPRVIDFGISRAATGHQTLTMTGRVIGTPPFMSPEQLQSPRTVGPESDVFSLATLLVYASTGQGPFDADSPYMTAYQVVHEDPVLGAMPAVLRDVVEPCLAKERKGRPSAHELLVALRALPEDLGPASAPMSELATLPGTGHPTTDTTPDGPSDGPHDSSHGGGYADAGGTGFGDGAGFGDGFGDGGALWELSSENFGSGSGSGSGSGGAPGSGSGGSGAVPDDDDGDRDALAPAPGTRSDGDRSDADPATGAGTASHGSRSPTTRTRARTRRALLVAAVAASAVALITTGVALLGPDGESGTGGTAGTTRQTQDSRVVAGGGAALPAGFAPWRKNVRGERSFADELRCVARAETLFCGGGGVLASRVRAADGEVEWRRTYPGVPVQGLHLVGVSGGSGPDLAGGTVIGYHIPAEGTERVEVVALDAVSGKERWRTRVGTKATYLLREPRFAVLSGSTVLTVDAGSTRIEARSARNGRLLWETPFPAGSWCAPFLADRAAYAMCAPAAQAATGRTGDAEFRVLDIEKGTLGAPAAADGRLRPVGARDGRLLLLRETTDPAGDGFAEVVRLDVASGRRDSADLDAGYPGTAPGLAGGTLYFTSPTGAVSAVDPVSGKEKWTERTESEWASVPLAVDGVLYLGSPTGRVTALDARNGHHLWTTPAHASSPGGFMGSGSRLTLVGRVLVAAAGDNALSAFDVAEPPRGE
ncbi:PQQ-binding-like beta-propeller repeat protein [Streptomyces uncialis]|uniref:serine/threonine-protein kinase n=1 Tax=Streptomyces uncialis TaxID=1048205 RepID=UPI0037B515F9